MIILQTVGVKNFNWGIIFNFYERSMIRAEISIWMWVLLTWGTDLMHINCKLKTLNLIKGYWKRNSLGTNVFHAAICYEKITPCASYKRGYWVDPHTQIAIIYAISILISFLSKWAFFLTQLKLITNL
jgi:hypothetical protein